MKNSLWLALAIVSPLVAVRAQDPWAPDTHVGDFGFNMPAGWSRQDGPGGTRLVPNDVGTGVAFIGFLPPQPLHGDLAAWFQAAWGDWQQQFRVMDSGVRPEAHRTTQGLAALRVYSRITSPRLGFSAFVFGAVQVGDQVESYYFVSNANRWSYLDDLRAFEQSLQFANAAPVASAQRATTDSTPAVQAGGASTGLDGLYIGYRMRGATPYESTHFEYLVFFPDGNAMRTLPWEGLEHVDFAEAVKSSRPYCGRYTMDGNRILIRWGDNSTETAVRAAAQLRIGSDSYFPVAKSNDLTLDGVYRREGTDLARYGIRFTTDGRFIENGMLPLVAYSLTSDKHIAQAPGKGAYHIASNTLTLRYDDGRQIALSFFIWPAESGSQPSAIHVETYRLVRDAR